MPNYIVKFAEGRYCKWSSAVDSPITYLTDTREEAIDIFGLTDIEKADLVGCSCCEGNLPGPSHVDQLLKSNSAGIDEEHIGLADILKVWAKSENR